MVKVGTVAVDGTKMHANAGLSANRELLAIREEIERILGEAAEVDPAEDALFGTSAEMSTRPSSLIARVVARGWNATSLAHRSRSGNQFAPPCARP
jgi:hypothetical protein